MAELMASVLAAGAGAGGAASAATWAAGTTVATAGGLTAALAPSSAALSGLQGLLTIGSMSSALLGGVMGMRDAGTSAKMAELEARGAQIDAEAKGLRIRREMVQKVAANRVAYAGSGLDISGGVPIEQSLVDQAEFETQMAQDSADIASARSYAAASQLRSRGLASMIGAGGKALGALGDFKISLARRG